MEAAIFDAIRRADAELVRGIIERDAAAVASTDAHRKTPLHLAAELDEPTIAEILLEAGAEIEARTTWGATPLEWAGVLGSRAVAALLLARGATDLNLTVAAGLGLEDVVRGLLDGKADLSGLGIPRRPTDHDDPRGWPSDAAHMRGDVLGEAFQLACRNGHVRIVAMLLARGAAVDAKGYFGGTGMHWAAHRGHTEVVRFLLDHGADRTGADPVFNATPAGWAREGGHEDLAQLIESDDAST